MYVIAREVDFPICPVGSKSTGLCVIEGGMGPTPIPPGKGVLGRALWLLYLIKGT